MEKNTVFARIINMNIKVLCADEEVCRYVCRELELHRCEDNEEKQNMIIDVKNEKFTINDDMKKVNECVYTDNCKVYICVQAFLRKTWIAVDIQDKETSYVELFIDKKNDKIKRLCTPNFQYPWQNSVVDFFHGIFLWLIENYMLEYGITLIHAAAFAYDEKKILLAADAAAGKSTVVDDIVLRHKGKYISEDYCFVDNLGNVYGLFNQRRIITSRKECRGVGDFCNFLFFSIVKLMKIVSVESIRIRSTVELYSKSDIICQGCQCEGFFLMREKNKDTHFDCAERCVKVMEKEIRNWDGCIPLMMAIDVLKPDENVCENFWDRLNVVIRHNIYASSMRKIVISYMKTKEEFVDCVCYELEKEKHES